jgi:hypothetical protein
MRCLALLLLACLAPSISPADALAKGALAKVELYDRSSGSTLPVYQHRGHLYVAGEPQHQYEIRIRSHSTNRVLAVASVDGVNVITGESAAEQQSGYVIGAYESVEIDGWRKSLSDVATFYFTNLGDSYAARTGRPDNVGVIGVALFRERVRCCARADEESRDAAKADMPSARERSESRAPLAESQLGTDLHGGFPGGSPPLATGHGHREDSAARYVDFERAAASPDETIVIYYDSMRNLMARGVVPRHRPAHAQHGPKPFPNGFVPDP